MNSLRLTPRLCVSAVKNILKQQQVQVCKPFHRREAAVSQSIVIAQYV